MFLHSMSEESLQRISHTLTTSHHFYLGSASHVPILEILSFSKGKTQLSRAEVEESRRLARVRIHVERVIGQLKKKYKILQWTLPITLIKRPSKKLLHALTNLSQCCCLGFSFLYNIYYYTFLFKTIRESGLNKIK